MPALSRPFCCAPLAWGLLVLGLACGAEIPSEPARPGVSELRIERPTDAESSIEMRGPDAAWQLVVTAASESGAKVDVTSEARYEAQPPGVVQVDEAGRLVPLADGQARVVARHGGQETVVEVSVTDYANQPPLHFANQIVPVFTRLGCNAGGCHGKSGGQNGFRLSLLGFEPADDYEFLIREDRGRRLFPAAPERSLLLLKATNAVPHGGGQKLDPASPEYQLLRRWIAQGMPAGAPDAPIVDRLVIAPDERRLAPETPQQLAVLAHYSDGHYEDVTRLAQLEATDTAMLELEPGGRLRTQRRPGAAAVMARFQGQVALFRAMIPLGAATAERPAPTNVIDEQVFAKLRDLGLPASDRCDDSTFIRRTALDIAGRLPTAAETEQFLADADPAKRARWVDRLLDSPEYADWFANKWSAVLRNKRRGPENLRGTLAFHRWIAAAMYENLPYDQFVRQIVAATGDVGSNPAVVWYREVKDTTQQVEDVSQLFLGVRIQCARCHHHPFERWSQDDYYRLAAFFSRVSKKPGRPGENVYFHAVGDAEASNPRTGQRLRPAGLGATALELPGDQDPRQKLVDWMVEPGNPFFARALVNRYWKHFFGRGIVEPEDDLRATNPATNEPLLAALAEEFRESGYDLKQLIRLICGSEAYQLSSAPNSQNADDQQAYSRHYPQRLPAEALLDAIDQVAGVTSDFAGAPVGTRAISLPDPGSDNYFLTVFGKPQADTACECERTQEASLAQSLHLLNSLEVQGKLTSDTGSAAQLAADASRTDEQKLADLYQRAYSRPPTAEETATVLSHLAARRDQPRQVWEDVIWSLINTKEFLFNH